MTQLHAVGEVLCDMYKSWELQIKSVVEVVTHDLTE